jgi:hypothetical protein
MLGTTKPSTGLLLEQLGCATPWTTHMAGWSPSHHGTVPATKKNRHI